MLPVGPHRQQKVDWVSLTFYGVDWSRSNVNVLQSSLQHTSISRYTSVLDTEVAVGNVIMLLFWSRHAGLEHVSLASRVFVFQLQTWTRRVAFKLMETAVQFVFTLHCCNSGGSFYKRLQKLLGCLRHQSLKRTPDLGFKRRAEEWLEQRPH